MLEGDERYVTEWARRRARQIVRAPPVPLFARPLLETVNFVTVALIPDPIREQYGFSPLPPAPVRKALVAGGTDYVKRAVMPFMPDRLRLVPESARCGAADNTGGGAGYAGESRNRRAACMESVERLTCPS
ncbi:MAG TPA: oxygenase MpaB family protein [Solirubrobacteraceae bacterium]|nr:oxygenase MpaB family protein [Solirubrobacteraceae bacterium]